MGLKFPGKASVVGVKPKRAKAAATLKSPPRADMPNVKGPMAWDKPHPLLGKVGFGRRKD